jgi:hypothetical protein
MSTKNRCNHVVVVTLFLVVVVFSTQAARADDLTESSRFLCVPVQATVCVEDGECAVDLPWNLNIPQFIEVDLEAKRLATTTASGLNRETPIEHLSRVDGTIVFHGFEMGRAFSWVIDEGTGHVTAAVATDGLAVAVFGACTPLVGPPEGDGSGKDAKP